MAKTPNGIGQFSGRVGGIVFAVRSGQQIVRAYQPIVTNPKSSAQSVQRAKANLVGRISKITPWQILEGLGDNKFNRRSRFLKLMLQKVTAGQAAGDPSKFNAKLDDNDFVFSEGAVVPYSIITQLNADATTVNFTVGRTSGTTAAIANAQGFLVVAVIKQSSGVWEEVLYQFVRPSDFVGGAYTGSFIHRAEGAYTVCLYGAPFQTADGSKLNTRAQDLTTTATSLDAILEVGTGASSIVWGSSSLGRKATFTPATTAATREKEE